MSWVMKIRQNAGGWEAELLDLQTRTTAVDPATGNPFLPSPRQLEAVKVDGAGLFPLPPQAERPAPAEDDLTRMRSGAVPKVIGEYFQKVVKQTIRHEEMKTFGSYLFHTLLGDALWQQMRAAAGNAETELVLSWSPALQELTRLPWEMMFGAKDFLLAETRIVIAREIADAPGKLVAINSPPRVLFVIGSTGGDSDFDGLKPGAEYFSLLRAVRQNGLGLNIFPLVGATAEKLEIAMQRFRPDVVHFVCHGNDDGSIDLVDASQGYKRVKTSADVIYRLLHPKDNPDGYTGPQIVVLNSCYSASTGGTRLANAGQVNFPMAVALVEKGVPVVLGMAGEVANQACRLFSRTFYESLLTDGLLPRAAAKGRRAGLMAPEGLGQRRIDWALPSLFVSPAAAGVQLQLAPNKADKAWQSLAEVFAPEPFPAYYARLDLLRLFGLLLLDEAEQKKVDPQVRGDRQFLGLSTPKNTMGRLGRSWALRDLASIAARNGHIPIVLEKRLPGGWPPLTPESLAKDFLIRAGRITSKELGRDLHPPLTFNWTNTTEVLALPADARPTANMAAEVSEIYITGDRNERLEMLATAIRLDLLEFQQKVRAAMNRPEARLILIFDDVHRMGDAALFLFKRLFGPDGLRGEREKIRVLFAFSRQPEQDDQTTAVQAVTEFLQQGFVDEYQMSEFRAPTETRLAYEQFLRNYRDENNTLKVLVPATENDPQVAFLFEQLQEQIRGIPSRFCEKETRLVLAFMARMPAPEALRIATDDQLLKDII